MKKRENFTIEENVIREFNDYVSKEGLNKSSIVESLIKELLATKKDKFEKVTNDSIQLLSQLEDELTVYEEKINPLLENISNVLEDEGCCDLLKEYGLYGELKEILDNTVITYQELAGEISDVYMKAKKILNKKKTSKDVINSFLKEELITVDKDYVIKNGIDYDKWVRENERLNLDINRYKYLKKPSVINYGEIYYFGDKVASKVFFTPEAVFSDTFGINIVYQRELLFEKNENENLRFHTEFNPFALYYFLKDYKNIDREQVFNIFEQLYCSITSMGIDKIPLDVINYVIECNPYTVDDIVEGVNECLNSNLTEDDTITIYNSYVGEINDLGWFLKKDSCLMDKNFNGIILEGTANIRDILAIENTDYGYILIKHNDVFDTKVKAVRSTDMSDEIEDLIVEYIKTCAKENVSEFYINDLIDYLEQKNISLDKDKLSNKVLNLAYITDRTKIDYEVIDYTLFTSIKIKSGKVTVKINDLLNHDDKI